MIQLFVMINKQLLDEVSAQAKAVAFLGTRGEIQLNLVKLHRRSVFPLVATRK